MSKNKVQVLILQVWICIMVSPLSSYRFVEEIPWAILNRFLQMCFTFGISILLVRALEPEIYGIYALSVGIAEILFLFCSLGLNITFNRFIPELNIQKNNQGVKRLLKQVAIFQGIAFCFFAGILYFSQSYLSQIFKIDFQFIFLFILGLVLGRLGENYFQSVFTALFQLRILSSLTTIIGFLWLGLSIGMFLWFPNIQNAFLSKIVPLFFFSLFAFYFFRITFLKKVLSPFEISKPNEYISLKRIYILAFPRLISFVVRSFLSMYSEIFFLSYFYPKYIVALYVVGCNISRFIVSFFPESLNQLLTSGASEVYHQNPSHLPDLIQEIFKIFIFLLLPTSIFGIFFSPEIVQVIYGEKMADAGLIASFFFGIHTLNQMRSPSTIAFIVKEKLFVLQPLLFYQAMINVTLNYYWIPQFEMYGAIASVYTTFLLSFPIHIYLVLKHFGKTSFPFVFFLKNFFYLMAIAFCFQYFFPPKGFFALVLVGILYGSLYLLGIRLFGLVHKNDFSYLKIKKIEKLLNMISR